MHFGGGYWYLEEREWGKCRPKATCSIAILPWDYLGPCEKAHTGDIRCSDLLLHQAKKSGVLRNGRECRGHRNQKLGAHVMSSWQRKERSMVNHGRDTGINIQ